MHFLRQIPARIAAIAILAVLSVGGLGYFAYGELKNALYEQKRLELAHEVEMAVGVVNSYVAREKSGELSHAAAQQAALATLRPLRFGADSNYFFIYRSDGTNVLLPTKPENEGKDLSGLKDQNGVFFVRELIAAAKAGGRSVAYLWVKPGDKEASEKLAYAGRVDDWDWSIGTGFHVQDINAWLVAKSRLLTLASIAIVLLLAGVAGAVGFGISTPLRRLTASMARLASGDLDAEVAGTRRHDEIGAIARAVVSFRDLLRRQLREQAEAEAQGKAEAEAIRIAERHAIADSFLASMGALANNFVTTSKEVSEAAQNLSATAEETSRQAMAVTAAAEEAALNVENVASSSEELAASVHEISAQVTRSSEISVAAANEAARTESQIRALSTAASKIGEVVSLINDIASQTNLLALNATIEAARAGEAGRGFAVVASEVKHLAEQTARATDEISTKVNEIQDATSTTVTSIGSIVATITTIREVTAAIASSVTQQGAATNEIAANTQRASAGTHEVTGNIQGVSQAAEVTGASAIQLTSLSGTLKERADELQVEVGRFVTRLRG